MPIPKVQTVKLSITLDKPIHAALKQHGREKGMEVGDLIQLMLTEYAIDHNLIDEKTSRELAMRESLIARAVNVAIRIIREGRFGSDITLKAFSESMKDIQWAADYEGYVADNPYKHGNLRKGQVNKQIGSRIRRAIGGHVAKFDDGRPAKTPVAGSVIQSYTAMESFDKDTVKAIA